MRVNTITFLFLLLFARNISPQEINPLDFFPHHVGDLWQYITYTQMGGEFTQVEVTSIDTSFTDSSITITKFNGLQEIYFKIFFNDSLTIWRNTPAGWGMHYDLDAEIGSYWLSDPYSQSYTKYIGESEAIVFEDTVLSREYWVGPDTLFELSYSKNYLALGLGGYYGEFEVGITELIGCIINGIQYGTIVKVEDYNKSALPSSYILNNFPNPFNGQTTIHYYLPVQSFITITVYDILGRKVENLYEGIGEAGDNYLKWIPNNQSSGIYFVVLRGSKVLLNSKIIYLK